MLSGNCLHMQRLLRQLGLCLGDWVCDQPSIFGFVNTHASFLVKMNTKKHHIMHCRSGLLSELVDSGVALESSFCIGTRKPKTQCIHFY